METPTDCSEPVHPT